MEIKITLTPDDFEHLLESTTPWAPLMDTWRDCLGVFEPYMPGKNPVTDAPALTWAWMHLVGDDYAALLLARSYLETLGHEYEVVYNTAMISDTSGGRAMGWALLTDYTPPSLAGAEIPS